MTAGKYDAYLLGWTGDYDAAFNFIGTFFGNLKENDFGTEASTPGASSSPTTCRRRTRSSTRPSAPPPSRRSTSRSWRSTCPGVPISHSPPALVVGPDVEGVIPSPLTAEEFDTVSVGGE